LNAKQDTTFSLHEKGIYVENYELGGKSYKMTVYAAQSIVNLNNDDLRMKGYAELTNHTHVKAGYTNKYGIIVLYDDNKKFQMILQISGSESPDKVARQWLNYLAIVVASDEQKGSAKNLNGINKLLTAEELVELWEGKEKEEILLDNVQFISQFDESIFGQCTGCWSSSCCRRAAEYMMGNTNIANCSDSIIARTAPSMSVLGKINIATFSNNSVTYTKETYNAAILNYDLSSTEEGLNYIIDRLRAGKPVLIGIHYTNGSKPPNNTNRATRHFMVVVGYKKDANGQESFRYYDPGRKTETDGASINNKLIVDKTQNSISGTYKNTETCTITEIVKTN
jgi:hypothetical protein